MNRTLTLKTDLAEIHRLTETVHMFGEDAGLDDEMMFDVNLVLEEVVTNIVSYGYDDDDAHEITVSIGSDGDVLTLRVEDDGHPFNPLEVPLPDISKPLEEREVGGLGIFFVRELMDDVVYERAEGKNILTMKKKLTR